MSEEEIIDNLLILKHFIELEKEENWEDYSKAIQGLLDLYQKEKEKNKNKNKILRNIREEFLKYNWKDANPIQTYNQVKSLYEAIYY